MHLSTAATTYGLERLKVELRDDGFPVMVVRIKQLHKKLGLRCKHACRFTSITDSNHRLPVVENRAD